MSGAHMFETTRCNQCGSEMLAGLTVCPSCGRQQNSARAGSLQPRTLLAVALAAVVLFAFNWLKPEPPTKPATPSPSAGLTSR
jgi:uncharacterized OB-fold protein